jgi:hypothetical protein
MDFSTVAAIMLAGVFSYSAWLTSIVFCAPMAYDRCWSRAPHSFRSVWSTGSASGSVAGERRLGDAVRT